MKYFQLVKPIHMDRPIPLNSYHPRYTGSN